MAHAFRRAKITVEYQGKCTEYEVKNFQDNSLPFVQGSELRVSGTVIRSKGKYIPYRHCSADFDFEALEKKAIGIAMSSAPPGHLANIANLTGQAIYLNQKEETMGSNGQKEKSAEELLNENMMRDLKSQENSRRSVMGNLQKKLDEYNRAMKEEKDGLAANLKMQKQLRRRK